LKLGACVKLEMGQGFPTAALAAGGEGRGGLQGAPGEARAVTGDAPLLGAEPPSAEIALLDADGVIVAVNAAWRASVTALGGELRRWGVGASYLAIARRFVPDFNEATLRGSLERLRTGKTALVRHPYAIKTTQGPQWRQVQITTLRLGAGVRFVAIHENLTELVRAQEALRRTSAELMTAQDDERRRIAIELHDSTSQHLAVLGMGLGRLRARTSDERSLEVLAEMSTALTEAVKETRVLSYLMKPNGLVQQGLVITAEDFVTGFARRTGLKVRFKATGDVDAASAVVQHAAFRILQEALSNVFRHAQASHAEASVSHTPGQLTLRIADNGRGFRTEGGEPAAEGVGISGMHARVEQLSGRLAIETGRTGTCVTAEFPLSRPGEADPQS
jgi:two-component system, NarL family, sensor kinase